MNDPLDDLLDARLHDEMPYIDDAGFTTRVLQELPESPSMVRSYRSLVIFLAALVSVVVAYFASGEGWFVREALAHASSVPFMAVIAMAATIGLIMTAGGLWAALDRTRDPLR